MTIFPDYDRMEYRRCGDSGLRLPTISLGLWHNFGSVDPFPAAEAMLVRAFELGVTHFDLANNYGPEPGSAEVTLGKVLKGALSGRRDELVLSTKAGYRMWDGPYGDGGSRKYLLSSLDQSLRRMGVEYVDIFYHHRPDPDTPLEESMLALDQAVRQGKALYVGLSNYPPALTRRAVAILRELRTPVVLHQPLYSMLHREPEEELLDALLELGLGCIVFSPLAQGLLTDRYLGDIPRDSRAAKPHGFLEAEQVTPRLVARLRALNDVARDRGQSLAQMALAWALRHPAVTSALVGASRVSQLEDSVGALGRLEFQQEELEAIDGILEPV
ncbi:MAG TPA: aldo/keto reductase [Longimicrobiales bacterium]|nr:aldo/keto reductase [Longimicrobiales bacterium]